MSCIFIDIHAHLARRPTAGDACLPDGSGASEARAPSPRLLREPPRARGATAEAPGMGASLQAGSSAPDGGSKESGERARSGVFALFSCEPGAIPPTGPFSCGLHPWHLDAARLGEDLEALRTILGDPRCLAVGECGLDRVVAIPWELQERAFAAQIEFSEELGKPLVVHCVRSIADVVHWRKRTRTRQPWILHGFAGGMESARQALRAGLHLGFGRGILAGGYGSLRNWPQEGATDPPLANASEFPRSHGAEWAGGRAEGAGIAAQGASLLDPPLSRTEQVFAALPLDRVFLETDDAPVAIEAVYARAAAVRGIGLEELAAAMVVNFKGCFPGGKDRIWTG